jgi:hypothetical protein
MIRARLKLFGLCAMVLGVMAVFTASAQAKPEWMVNGANITTNTLAPEVQVKEVEKLGEAGERHLVLLTEILKFKTEILCEGMEFRNIKLQASGTTTEGDIHFSKCITKLNGVTNASCVPKSKEQEAGLILTEPGKGTIVTHILKDKEGKEIGKDALVLVKPTNAEERFVTVLMSEACPIGEKVPIKGEFFIKDCKGLAETEEVDHLMEEGPLTHLYAITDTAEHAAKIDGSAIARLVGAHLGLKWSGLAL